MGKFKDIDVKGRGLIEGRVTVQATAEGLTIEVDDKRNPETWVHIHIDRDFLRALMVSCEARGAAEGHYFNNGKRAAAKPAPVVELPDIPPQAGELPDIPPGWNGG